MMSVEGLESHRMAETPFEDATPIEHNPKIQMDDGSVRYGCQVWWKPITPVEEVKDADLGIPEQE
jgi:hypothetical protein